MKTCKKKRESIYYGVAGSNAYGVYDAYNKIVESQKYVKKFKCHKFMNKNQAIDWALDTYNELEPEGCGYFCLEEPKRLNRMYFTKYM